MPQEEEIPQLATRVPPDNQNTKNGIQIAKPVDNIPVAIPVDNIPVAIPVACDKPEKPPCAKRVIAILNTQLLVSLANDAATQEDIDAIRELVNRGVSPHARDDTYQQSAWQRFKFWMNCSSSISHLRSPAYNDPKMLSKLKGILGFTSL